MENGSSTPRAARRTLSWAAALTFGLMASASAQEAIAIVGGTLIDGRGGAPVENAVVVFAGERIAAVGPADAVRVPAGARIIDASGHTVLPGLIDTHMHIGGSGGGSADPREFTPEAVANNFKSYLKFGVTTVYDMAGNPFLDQLKGALDAGALVGPRLYGNKFAVTAPGAHPMGLLREYKLLDLLGDNYFEVASVAEAKAALATIAAGRADGLKIMHSRSEFPGASRYDADRDKLAPEVLKTLIDDAHAQGLRVFAHIAFPSEAREVIEAGGDVLVHSIGMSETGTEAIFADMAKRGVAYIPTLAQIEANFALYADPFQLDRLRGKVWDVILDSITHANSVARARHNMTGYVADARRNLETSLANLTRAHKAGVRIAMGTDAGNAGTMHGATVPREMALLHQAGLTPMDAIVAATGNAAAVIGQADALGTVEAGKLADLVVIAGDPLRDIADIAKVALVVRGGVVIDPATLTFDTPPVK